jgi:hypothetical protein
MTDTEYDALCSTLRNLMASNRDILSQNEDQQLFSGFRKLITEAGQRLDRRETIERLLQENPAFLSKVQAAILIGIIHLAFRGAPIQEVVDTARFFFGDQQHAIHAMAVMAVLGNLHHALEILMGEGYHHPLEDVCANLGLSQEQYLALSDEEKVERIKAAGPGGRGWIDTVKLVLDMIFEQRYGWAAGTADKLSLAQMWFALDHALETDKMDDPKGIWKLTK